MSERPVLVFDSGIGGLSVLREARVIMPGRRFVYVADDAGFPYGRWEEGALSDRIVGLSGALIFQRVPAETIRYKQVSALPVCHLCVVLRQAQNPSP